MLRVQSLSKAFQQPVLTEVSFELSKGQKAGLIGPNGCGKTTLLRLIAGTLRPDAGEVICDRVAYLAQEEKPDVALGGYMDLTFWQALAALEAAGFSCPELWDRFSELGGYSREARILQELERWGLSVELTRSLGTLSGGERSRAKMARLTLQSGELLLLDEPSNHLDEESVEELCLYLERSQKTCLLVSHDRYLLDRTTETTLVLDPLTQGLAVYAGGYTQARTQWESERRNQWSVYLEQQRQRRRLESDIARTKTQARSTEASTTNDFLRGRAKKVARKATSRARRLERTVAKSHVEKPRSSGCTRLELGGRELGGKVLVCYRGLNLIGGQRVLLQGPNGCGKTTFMRHLLEHGERRPDLSVGYLPQEGLPPSSRTAFDWLQERNGKELLEGQLRTFLHRFLFTGDEVFLSLAQMSPGQRSRLALAGLMLQEPDLIVVDEPTNHLDLDAVESLEEGLVHYPGCVLAVSHDRRFCDSQKWDLRLTDF